MHAQTFEAEEYLLSLKFSYWNHEEVTKVSILGPKKLCIAILNQSLTILNQYSQFILTHEKTLPICNTETVDTHIINLSRASCILCNPSVQNSYSEQLLLYPGA